MSGAQNGLTGNPLTAGVDRALKPSRMESAQHSRSISLFRLEMISLAISIRLVFFISTTLHCLPLRRATSSSVPGLWRDTWMVVMMMVMVVVMGMNNHYNLRLRRYRNCREAEDENQSKQ
jgi:hypothetical protein